MSDALKPLKFILTGGEEVDCLQAVSLLEGESAKAVLADKGYDAGYIVDAIVPMDAEVFIPPKSNRKEPRKYDDFLYKERNVIEMMFGKM